MRLQPQPKLLLQRYKDRRAVVGGGVGCGGCASLRWVQLQLQVEFAGKSCGIRHRTLEDSLREHIGKLVHGRCACLELAVRERHTRSTVFIGLETFGAPLRHGQQIPGNLSESVMHLQLKALGEQLLEPLSAPSSTYRI